jgi:hypothetical protein
VFVGHPLDKKPDTYLFYNLARQEAGHLPALQPRDQAPHHEPQRALRRGLSLRRAHYRRRRRACVALRSSTPTRPPSSRSSRTPMATRSRTLPPSPGTSLNQWEFLPSARQWESVGR